MNKNPTIVCTICKGKTVYNEELIGKAARTQEQCHAHCFSCEAHFSNASNPENRKIIWSRLEQNVYPNDDITMTRLLKNIIPNAMNLQNRKKKYQSMCYNSSEDSLTWTVFNVLEKHDLIGKTYSYLTGEKIKGYSEVYYWGYNDKYPYSKMISEYMRALQRSDEPNWGGGYSEPDILLFNPDHGLINIEVKYQSPNTKLLKYKQPQYERAQRMLEVGDNYVKRKDPYEWKWYELLRMWVPGCLVAERMNLKSFTLINLLPQEMLKEEKGKVSKDMSECLQLDNKHRFKQITWEDFLSEIKKWNVITDIKFWDYLKRKLPSLNFA